MSTSATMTRMHANRFDGDLNFNRTSKVTCVRSISLTIKSHKHTPSRFIEEYKRLPETDRRLCIDRSHFHHDHNILPKVLYVRKPCLYYQRIKWEFNAEWGARARPSLTHLYSKFFIFQDSWGTGVETNTNWQLTSHHILFPLISLCLFVISKAWII